MLSKNWSKVNWLFLCSVYGIMACGNPEDVKVRRRDTKEVIPKTGGPQKYKSYDKTMGFQCYNKDQVDGQCLDYEISLCCPAGKL